jgi:hypothetical protein
MIFATKSETDMPGAGRARSRQNETAHQAVGDADPGSTALSR